MARCFFAGLRNLRPLRKHCEICTGVDNTFFSTPNVGAIRSFGGSQGSPTKPFSVPSRRLMSSYDDIDGTRIQGKDRLIMRGCKFQGYHGVMTEEKSLGQKFVVDMDAWLDLKKPCESDDLEESVSYADVFSKVRDVVEGPSRNLLESVANDIARSLVKSYPQITDVRVRLYKYSPPVSGFVDKLGVEIHRTSSDFTS